MNRQPQRLSSTVKTENLCMDNRENTRLLNTSPPPSCILYLSQCVLCIEESMTFQ